MVKIILKILPALIFWGVFTFVILQIPYPETLTQANLLQVIPFFVSLFLALSFSFNIFLKKYSLSLAISLGIIFLLILQALDSLNLVTGLLTAVAIYFLIDYFRKIRKNPGLKNLTKTVKIPKLTRLR